MGHLIGGDLSKDDSNWQDIKRDLFDWEEREIASRVIEVAVITAMDTHVYSFADKIYIQQSGGPIGMRSTASLANLVMRMYDCSLMQICREEGLVVDLFCRYVDDCRIILPSLNVGWWWVNHTFVYTDKQADKDRLEGLTDQQRTSRELTKMMSSLCYFLRFTAEESSMFSCNTLPTLDTRIWEEEGMIRYAFYEKPTVGNRVIQKNTALPEQSISSSMIQEVVRRMINCCEGIDISKRQQILSNYAQKIVNSGFNQHDARVILVQGVTKYFELVRRSKLDSSHAEYKPIHLSNEFKESERQINKYLAKMTWYDRPQDVPASKWRSKLEGCWRGNRPIQAKVKGYKYTTVLQVPSTKGSRLLRQLASAEPRLTKASGYCVKLVEKSGIQLSRMFDRVFRPKLCHSNLCTVCKFSSKKSGSKCRLTNVVYKASCMLCLEQKSNVTEKKDGVVGVYIGETSRCLFERSSEHLEGLERGDESNFIVKHWAEDHTSSLYPPKMKFEVIQTHQDALSRLLQEAVLIEEEGSMNSKQEWRQNTKQKLIIEPTERDKAEAAVESAVAKKESELNIRLVTSRIIEKKYRGSKPDIVYLAPQY